MQLQKILVPVGSAALVALSYRQYGWQGVAAASALLVMWVLLHFTRTLQVLKRASSQPVGYVGSAVMLHAKLHKGMSLLHVIAMTKSLGERMSEQDAQPERFRWTDSTQSQVNCQFVSGKLVSWELARP